MKVITDWTVTKTSLDLYQWFRVEDATMYIYYNKYMADWRRKKPEFDPQTKQSKFLYGILFNLSLVVLILAPIMLFSGMNPVMMVNPIINADMEIDFELMNNGKIYQIYTAKAFNVKDLPEKGFK